MEYRATPAYHRCHKYISVSLCVSLCVSLILCLSQSLSLSLSVSLGDCLWQRGPFHAQRCSKARGNRVFTTTANTLLRHGDRWAASKHMGEGSHIAGSCRAAIPFHNEQTLVGQRASLR